MPTLNMTISVPTQQEVDDFCAAFGYTTGNKGEFAKSVIATYIKNVVSGYRVNKVRAEADAAIKQVSDATAGLVIK